MVLAGGRGCPVVHGAEKCQVGTERLAGQLGGRHRLDDPAAVDQRIGCVEQLDAIEKERPLLGEEDFLSGVEGKLLHVRLDLGEIGIGGTVQREIVGDTPADGAPKLGAPSGVVPALDTLGSGAPGGHRGGDVENHPPSEILESDQPAELRQERGAGPLGGSPGVLVSGVLHLADDVDAPVLLRLGLKAEALERNPDLHLVPVLG